MSENPPAPITTPVLTNLLREINARLDLQQKTRHEANTELQRTILKFGHEAIVSHDRIEDLERIVKKVADSMAPFAEVARDFRTVKDRLVGDPSMKTDGLFTEHNEFKKELQNIKQLAGDTKKEQRIAVVVLVAVAGIIGWFQTTGALNILKKSEPEPAPTHEHSKP